MLSDSRKLFFFRRFGTPHAKGCNMKLSRKISFFVLLILLLNTALPVHAGRAVQALSFDRRIAYQRALDAVTWQNTLFPSQGTKPSLAEVLPSSVSQRK